MNQSPQVGLVDAYRLYWKNFTNFSGRATRPEYWWATLANLIVYLVIFILTVAIKTPVFYILFALVNIIPGLSLTVRRLHDTDRTGWWILAGLIPFLGAILLLVFECTASTPGPNRYGS